MHERLPVACILPAVCGLGFWDDWRMLYRGRAMGLPARQKLGAQLLLAIIFVIVLRALHYPLSNFSIPFTNLHWHVAGGITRCRALHGG